jgi:alkylation response protein AidB-like acyl-CoA dehydrogenase
MQLTFDADVESFRAEFVAFLDQHVPTAADSLQRSRSSSDVPPWARRWQRLLFDNGWLVPGNPPEFGGRNASILQQYVYFEELSRRRMVHSFNIQGVGIIAASLLTFGTPEQKAQWADPACRHHRGARHERAGRGVRPRVTAHQSRVCLGRRRALLRGERAEGLDVGCA